MNAAQKPRGGRQPSGQAIVASRARAGVWARTAELALVVGGKERAEEILRDIVHQETGQSSTRSLKPQQARAISARLMEIIQAETCGQASRATTRAARAQTEDGKAVVTREQADALLELAGLLGMDRDALHAWIRGRMASVVGGMPWPQTVDQAVAIHEGLEAMLWRRDENRPAVLLERARAARALPEITDWETAFLDDLIKRLGKAERTPTRSGFRRSWKTVSKLAEIEAKRGGAR